MNELDVFRAAIEKRADSFRAVLATDHATAHFIQSLVTIVGKNPEWLDESQYFRPALYQAAMDAAEVGLPLATNLRQAYFVPRWSKKTGKKHVAYEISVHGLKSLAFRNGTISGFQNAVVRKGDLFEFSLGTDAFLKHVPVMPNPGEVIAVWATAEFVSGAKPVFAIVWREELEKIKKLSKSDFWTNWYDEMAKKTALRRLCKLLDVCPELQRAIAIEERNEGELLRDCTPRPTGAGAALREKLLPAPAAAHPPPEQREEPVEDASGGESTPPPGDDLSFDPEKVPDA